MKIEKQALMMDSVAVHKTWKIPKRHAQQFQNGYFHNSPFTVYICINFFVLLDNEAILEDDVLCNFFVLLLLYMLMTFSLIGSKFQGFFVYNKKCTYFCTWLCKFAQEVYDTKSIFFLVLCMH